MEEVIVRSRSGPPNKPNNFLYVRSLLEDGLGRVAYCVPDDRADWFIVAPLKERRAYMVLLVAISGGRQKQGGKF